MESYIGCKIIKAFKNNRHDFLKSQGKPIPENKLDGKENDRRVKSKKFSSGPCARGFLEVSC